MNTATQSLSHYVLVIRIFLTLYRIAANHRITYTVIMPYVLKNMKTGEYFFLKRFTITSIGEIISNSNPLKKTEMKFFWGNSTSYCRENFLKVAFVCNHENSANNKYRTTVHTNTHGKIGDKMP